MMKSLNLNFIFALFLSFATIIFADDCSGQSNETSDSKVADQIEQMMSESNKVVGMPNIINWNEKKLVRDLYELRDTEDLLTYTYIINMHGERLYLGRSIGFGIPASVQFSNPERGANYREEMGMGRWSEAYGSMPQPEPNGLFMPEGLSATWVFLLDADGEPRPVYVEPEIVVSPFKLH